ncbi:MarR family winged helix-turn-helix transcriptional regulator [Granulosicoccus sp. 3-233]|uniref:MarR family winged helix-turn-helix transcriptional regulator n=1 Tax=Granulosicoccus sp. 3-233 TaxID=3417969 RepID=UPI003D332F73
MIPGAIPSVLHQATRESGKAARNTDYHRGHVIDIQPAQDTKRYRLDEQVGYLLRLANQRHLEIFNSQLPTLTPTQFSVLARLQECEDISQNELGRSVGIDAATTNGVIDRLGRKKLISTQTDTKDRRRLRISLTDAGHQAIREAIPVARNITRLTLQQLGPEEAEHFTRLLRKLLPPP